MKMRVYEALESALAGMMSIIARWKIHVATDPGASTKRRRDLFNTAIPTGGIGAEIGVHKGRLSHWILEHNRPRRLHLIDPWWKQDPSNWEWSTGDASPSRAGAALISSLSKQIDEGTVIVHVDYDENVLETIDDAYFDWVYLDTTHRYDDTRRELCLLMDKVKPGGLIAGDDWYDQDDHYHSGVRQAVEEVLEANSELELVYCSQNQWALRNGEAPQHTWVDTSAKTNHAE